MKDRLVLDVYQQIMRWLEGNIEVPAGKNILTIPVKANDKLHDLRFRRVALMGGASRADSLDKEGVSIPYDPNWESLLKIEGLING
jgi:hypothetical protein